MGVGSMVRWWSTAAGVLWLSAAGCVGAPPPPPGSGGTTDAPTTTDATASDGSASMGSTTSGSSGSAEGDGTTTGLSDDTTTLVGTGSSGELSAGSTGSTGLPPGDTSSGGPEPATCDDIFGPAPDYVLCESDEMSCTFAVSTGGGSCDDVCGLFGEMCLGAIDNPALGAGMPCAEQGPYTCDETVKNYTMCICTR